MGKDWAPISRRLDDGEQCCLASEFLAYELMNMNSTAAWAEAEHGGLGVICSMSMRSYRMCTTTPRSDLTRGDYCTVTIAEVLHSWRIELYYSPQVLRRPDKYRSHTGAATQWANSRACAAGILRLSRKRVRVLNCPGSHTSS